MSHFDVANKIIEFALKAESEGFIIRGDSANRGRPKFKCFIQSVVDFNWDPSKFKERLSDALNTEISFNWLAGFFITMGDSVKDLSDERKSSINYDSADFQIGRETAEYINHYWNSRKKY